MYVAFPGPLFTDLVIMDAKNSVQFGQCPPLDCSPKTHNQSTKKKSKAKRRTQEQKSKNVNNHYVLSGSESERYQYKDKKVANMKCESNISRPAVNVQNQTLQDEYVTSYNCKLEFKSEEQDWPELRKAALVPSKKKAKDGFVYIPPHRRQVGESVYTQSKSDQVQCRSTRPKDREVGGDRSSVDLYKDSEPAVTAACDTAMQVECASGKVKPAKRHSRGRKKKEKKENSEEDGGKEMVPVQQQNESYQEQNKPEKKSTEKKITATSSVNKVKPKTEIDHNKDIAHKKGMCRDLQFNFNNL